MASLKTLGFKDPGPLTIDILTAACGFASAECEEAATLFSRLAANNDALAALTMGINVLSQLNIKGVKETLLAMRDEHEQ